MSALGTELKINVHVDPIDGLHMSDYDFECAFFVYTNKKVVITKKEMKKVDDDNYIALIDKVKGLQLGRGTINMEITAHIPDGDFDDGLRTEKTTICTGVTIV